MAKKTNGEQLVEDLQKIVEIWFEKQPVTAEIAQKMIDDKQYRIAVLSVVTRLCKMNKNIFAELMRQVIVSGGIYEGDNLVH